MATTRDGCSFRGTARGELGAWRPWRLFVGLGRAGGSRRRRGKRGGRRWSNGRREGRKRRRRRRNSGRRVGGKEEQTNYSSKGAAEERKETGTTGSTRGEGDGAQTMPAASEAATGDPEPALLLFSWWLVYLSECASSLVEPPLIERGTLQETTRDEIPFSTQ